MKSGEFQDIYELTPRQEAMLVQTLLTPESTVYNIQLDLELLARYTILRTSFVWEDLDRPYQVVHHTATLPVTRLDWRELSTRERKACIASFVEDDRSRVLALDEAPLARAAIIRLTAAGSGEAGTGGPDRSTSRRAMGPLGGGTRRGGSGPSSDRSGPGSGGGGCRGSGLRGRRHGRVVDGAGDIGGGVPFRRPPRGDPRGKSLKKHLEGMSASLEYRIIPEPRAWSIEPLQGGDTDKECRWRSSRSLRGLCGKPTRRRKVPPAMVNQGELLCPKCVRAAC